MGNTCGSTSTDDAVTKANLPNHKRKGPKSPTMVSFDFDNAKGQMKSLEALATVMATTTQEEGKRGEDRKQLRIQGYTHAT